MEMGPGRATRFPRHQNDCVFSPWYTLPGIIQKVLKNVVNERTGFVLVLQPKLFDDFLMPFFSFLRGAGIKYQILENTI